MTTPSLFHSLLRMMTGNVIHHYHSEFSFLATGMKIMSLTPAIGTLPTSQPLPDGESQNLSVAAAASTRTTASPTNIGVLANLQQLDLTARSSLRAATQTTSPLPLHEFESGGTASPVSRRASSSDDSADSLDNQELTEQGIATSGDEAGSPGRRPIPIALKENIASQHLPWTSGKLLENVAKVASGTATGHVNADVIGRRTKKLTKSHSGGTTQPLDDSTYSAPTPALFGRGRNAAALSTSVSRKLTGVKRLLSHMPSYEISLTPFAGFGGSGKSVSAANAGVPHKMAEISTLPGIPEDATLEKLVRLRVSGVSTPPLDSMQTALGEFDTSRARKGSPTRASGVFLNSRDGFNAMALRRFNADKAADTASKVSSSATQGRQLVGEIAQACLSMGKTESVQVGHAALLAEALAASTAGDATLAMQVLSRLSKGLSLDAPPATSRAETQRSPHAGSSKAPRTSDKVAAARSREIPPKQDLRSIGDFAKVTSGEVLDQVVWRTAQHLSVTTSGYDCLRQLAGTDWEDADGPKRHAPRQWLQAADALVKATGCKADPGSIGLQAAKWVDSTVQDTPTHCRLDRYRRRARVAHRQDG